MKHHVMLALGFLMIAIFLFQGLDVLRAPGHGIEEVYVAGGLVLGGWLLMGGRSEWRAARKAREA